MNKQLTVRLLSAKRLQNEVPRSHRGVNTSRRYRGMTRVPFSLYFRHTQAWFELETKASIVHPARFYPSLRPSLIVEQSLHRRLFFYYL